MIAESRVVPNGFKQTDVGVIPDDWNAASIGSFASFQSGEGISVAALSVESSDTPIPVFGGNGVAGYTKRELVYEPVVVVGRVGQKCGETYLTAGPAWVTDNALYPRFLSDHVDTRFLAYALKGAGLNDVKNHNDLPLVTQSILHSFSIPLPPTVAEQEAIAEALGDADALIESLEQLVAKKRHLKQAAMQQLLTGRLRVNGKREAAGDNGLPSTWRIVPICDVAKLESGHTPSRHEPAYWNGSIPWVSLHDSKNLDVKEIHRTELTVSELGLANSSARLLPQGTVIFSRTATVGKCTVLGRPMATSQDFANYVCGPLLHNHFLVALFRGMQNVWRSLMAGSTHNTVYMPAFKALTITLPPLDEQLAIAEMLSDMETEIGAIETKLAKARQIKQGMMQELLTGRTRLV